MAVGTGGDAGGDVAVGTQVGCGGGDHSSMRGDVVVGTWVVTWRWGHGWGCSGGDMGGDTAVGTRW
jgi:hypothetical protein